MTKYLRLRGMFYSFTDGAFNCTYHKKSKLLHKFCLPEEELDRGLAMINGAPGSLPPIAAEFAAFQASALN